MEEATSKSKKINIREEIITRVTLKEKEGDSYN